MLRRTPFALCLFISVSMANAHFVFVVPQKDGRTADVILSEDLQADADVSIDVIAGAKLKIADLAGHETSLKLDRTDHSYTVELGSAQTAVIYGIADLGVMKRGDTRPCLLTYYPKTIVGDPLNPATRLNKRAPLELLPTGSAGKFAVELLFAGQPVADAEIDVIQPDGSQRKVMTDKTGKTAEFTAPGRFGFWARHVQPIAGEKDGKHYDEIRQYATLVIDAPNPPAVSASFAPMPQPASSFGAVASDNWLYLYGGHIADTHSYSLESVSGQFHRLSLADHKTWETLPGGPPLQGLNLAAWHGKIYRVGGMMPHNKAGEDADVRSVADCACFDPATSRWTAMPPLPEPRSSHDIAVIGDQLWVVGGWNLTGGTSNAHWLETALSLDLAVSQPRWKSIPQPFKRRALIAASCAGKLYAIGGFMTESAPSPRVDILDPTTGTWSAGPALPGPDRNGFGPAACNLAGNLYVSVADGTLYRLDQTGTTWDAVAKTTPRIVHRLAPNGSNILVIGGAAKQKQLSLIESVPVETTSTAAAQR
jgi:uncharacterized GH25 family protein